MKSNLIEIFDTLGKQDEQPESYRDRFKVKNIPGGIILQGRIITFNSILGAPVSIPLGTTSDKVGFLINTEEFAVVGGYAVAHNNGGSSDLYLEGQSGNKNSISAPNMVFDAVNKFNTIDGNTGSLVMYTMAGPGGSLKLNNVNRLGFFAYYLTTAPNNPASDPLQYIDFVIKLLTKGV